MNEELYFSFKKIRFFSKHSHKNYQQIRKHKLDKNLGKRLKKELKKNR